MNPWTDETHPVDTTQRPVAVYGTLREGEGNWAWAIQPHGVTARAAVIHDYAMYPMSGFPYVIPQEGAQVIVDIFDFAPDQWHRALNDLDGLEGYHGEGASNHYDRRVVTAVLEDGEEIEVYTYIANDIAGTRAEYEYYPSGDWKEYKAELRSRRSHANVDVATIIAELLEAQQTYHGLMQDIFNKYPENAVNHAIHLINTYENDDEEDEDADVTIPDDGYDPERDDAPDMMVDEELSPYDFDGYYDPALDGSLQR